MRKFSQFVISVLLLFSCSEDHRPLPLDLVTRIKGIDLGNNGNSSDIRSDFKVKSNENVEEYRIMIVPSKDTSAFTIDIAVSIPELSYQGQIPEKFKFDYSVNRLPAGMLDVNGASIINNVEYVAVIFVKGIDDFQLSQFSRPFTLIDQGIYAGYYEGRINYIITRDFDPAKTPGCFDPMIDGPYPLYCIINNTTADQYLGYVYDTDDTNFGSFSFTVAGDSIPSASWGQEATCYDGDVDNPCHTCNLGDPCNAIFTGSGTINSEIMFGFAIEGYDCVGLNEITMTITRY